MYNAQGYFFTKNGKQIESFTDVLENPLPNTNNNNDNRIKVAPIPIPNMPDDQTYQSIMDYTNISDLDYHRKINSIMSPDEFFSRNRRERTPEELTALNSYYMTDIQYYRIYNSIMSDSDFLNRNKHTRTLYEINDKNNILFKQNLVDPAYYTKLLNLFQTDSDLKSIADKKILNYSSHDIAILGKNQQKIKNPPV